MKMTNHGLKKPADAVRLVLAIKLMFLMGTALLRAEHPVSVAGDALIVVGAGGTDEYLEDFRRSAKRWQTAFPATVKTTSVGMLAKSQDSSAQEDTVTDRQQILDWIADEPKSPGSERWLIFIGHGTYQLKIANFNLEGPDISADELANALASSSSRWRIFVCSSCSGPFINALSAPNRIIVTATKSGSEQNYSRFGDYLSQSINASTSDLDHDGSISVLEAFLVASKNLANWYTDEGRLASEQALLDDNGDKRGTPANFFRGVRAEKAPSEGLKIDGRLANRVYIVNPLDVTSWSPQQQAKITELEALIDELRDQKAKTDEATYYAQLEQLLIELANSLVIDSSNSNSAP